MSKNEILRIANGFHLELILPGHENELGHPIDDRVPFWGDSQFLQLTYPELKRSAYRVIVMTDAKILTDEQAGLLRDWVKEGGVLIAV